MYRDDEYKESILGKYMDEQEFKVLIADMNRTLHCYWPCNFCVWFGYLLAPFTLGLSFFAPWLCISESKNGLIAAINRRNTTNLKEKGL